MSNKLTFQNIFNSLKNKIPVPWREAVANFFFQSVTNAFLLAIGLGAPLWLIVHKSYGLGFSSFNPNLYHFIFFALCCLPFGALLTVLGVRDGGKYFATTMAYFFVCGAFLPFIIGPPLALVLHLILYLFLSTETISIVHGGMILVLILMGLFYGIIQVIKGESLESWIASESNTNDSSEDDSIFDDSESASDGGSDGGGDGGD